jgi:hypothetical protein
MLLKIPTITVLYVAVLADSVVNVRNCKLNMYVFRTYRSGRICKSYEAITSNQHTNIFEDCCFTIIKTPYLAFHTFVMQVSKFQKQVSKKAWIYCFNPRFKSINHLIFPFSDVRNHICCIPCFVVDLISKYGHSLMKSALSVQVELCLTQLQVEV